MLYNVKYFITIIIDSIIIFCSGQHWGSELQSDLPNVSHTRASSEFW